MMMMMMMMMMIIKTTMMNQFYEMKWSSEERLLTVISLQGNGQQFPPSMKKLRKLSAE